MLNQYIFADYSDVSSDPVYLGFIDSSGRWYIKEINKGNGTVRFQAGSSEYSTNWTNKANLSYGYLNTVF